MSKTRAHLSILVDRTGSMASHGLDAEATQAIRDFIAKQAKLDEVIVRVTLAQFNTRYQPVYSRQKAAEVPAYTLVPNGMTALYDAIGKHLVETEGELSKLEKAPDKVLLVIVTDGLENSSKEYSFDAVKKLLDEKRAKGWEVVFLASEPASVEIGRALHMTTASYSGAKGGTRAAYGQTATAAADFFVTDAPMKMPKDIPNPNEPEPSKTDDDATA